TGCQNSANSSIFIEMPPVASFTADSIQGPWGHLFSFASTSVHYPGSSLLWNFDDPASGANNQSTFISPTHYFTDTGLYAVKLTVGGVVCAPDTEVKVIKVYRPNNVGIKQTPAAKALVYPNPATDFITVEGEELTRIRLLDIQGRYIPLAVTQTTGNQYSLQVKTLAAGVYFMEITDAYNNIAQVKITVQP
ncbi:MAG TPA: T9SS type A sorting domain-containing protein, partial [Bacteroidia bacterium]|nr:T9SS type A sorting domain-containing protein [Bacteroidia bacterium]